MRNTEMAKQHRILVADDDELVRSVMKTLLVYRGYHVQEAVDGKDAVEQYSASPESIDLVMMDMNMPSLGGREALQELKRMKPDIKAILISGGVDAMKPHEPSVRYLQKPFINDELVDAVGDLLA